jgi:hypothetical protein
VLQQAEPQVPMLLSVHHILAMRPEHRRMLLGRLDGIRHSDLAAALGVSAATVKLWVSIASAEIGMCLPPGVTLTPELRGAWMFAHVECCLGEPPETRDIDPSQPSVIPGTPPAAWRKV